MPHPAFIHSSFSSSERKISQGKFVHNTTENNKKNIGEISFAQHPTNFPSSFTERAPNKEGSVVPVCSVSNLSPFSSFTVLGLNEYLLLFYCNCWIHPVHVIWFGCESWETKWNLIKLFLLEKETLCTKFETLTSARNCSKLSSDRIVFVEVVKKNSWQYPRKTLNSLAGALRSRWRSKLQPLTLKAVIIWPHYQHHLAHITVPSITKKMQQPSKRWKLKTWCPSR